MSLETTLIMIKPDGVADGHSGVIVDRIEKEGFKIKAMKRLQLTKAQSEKFYEVHKERPFYRELTEFMSSGPIIAAALERDNAIKHWRDVIGATDPAEAADGTIRKMFARSKAENAVHGSDSVENGQLEASFFFSGLEFV